MLEPPVELVRPSELESGLPRPYVAVAVLKTQVLVLRALEFESEPFASRQLGEVRVEVGVASGSRSASASCPRSQPTAW